MSPQAKHKVNFVNLCYNCTPLYMIYNSGYKKSFVTWDVIIYQEVKNLQVSRQLLTALCHAASPTKYYGLSMYHGIMVIYGTIVRTQHKNNNDKTLVRFALMNDTPYLALTGELWGVYLELYRDKRLQYIESTLSHVSNIALLEYKWAHYIKKQTTYNRLDDNPLDSANLPGCNMHYGCEQELIKALVPGGRSYPQHGTDRHHCGWSNQDWRRE